ncbi:ABC transporter ATP-binding protein [Sulfurimonas marina]|uniref:Cell division ATP-binding protein FtsE n=1 Tax=Sulfurimonas marina TaxID=2590551 RepID=A0A7M1AW06_9BACT|nr:ABC transporter ATP-binding protein [Sulfurimonas marina]QOP41594.1 ABC transporter ATP-binding protein [Sulfurimonas marina]
MIQLIDINKSYKDKIALKDINLSFKEGELIVLKGVSGSGKTTILSLISALLKPTSGEVIVDGKKLAKIADHFASEFRRDNIGFIFQRYNLIPNMSVAENILLPLRPLNLSKKELQTRLERLLDMYKLQEYKDNYSQNLSGGQQQRVAIARAIVNNPKIILADEPTSNLDRELSLEFIEQIKALKSENKTIIIATHDPLFFELDFVDRIIEIENGQLKA